MTKMVLDSHSVDEAKRFTNIVRHYDFAVDAMCQQYVVDAKSILGVLSLDLCRPVTVYVRSDDCDDCDELMEKLMVFAYENSVPEKVEDN